MFLGERRILLFWIVHGQTRIEFGIQDYRATGQMLRMSHFLVLKAEALHLAHPTSEALETIEEAAVFIQRTGARSWSAELYRLRGVFLATVGADEADVEGSFCEAIRTAKEQRSISLMHRAESIYAEYAGKRRARWE